MQLYIVCNSKTLERCLHLLIQVQSQQIQIGSGLTMFQMHPVVHWVWWTNKGVSYCSIGYFWGAPPFVALIPSLHTHFAHFMAESIKAHCSPVLSAWQLLPPPRVLAMFKWKRIGSIEIEVADLTKSYWNKYQNRPIGLRRPGRRKPVNKVPSWNLT